MSAPTIRTDFDGLQQVAQTFSRRAKGSKRQFQSIKSQKDVLEGGDWAGKGHAAFYFEMNDAVMPTPKRLAGALEYMWQSTAQISDLMMQANADAAQVLEGDARGA